MLQSVVRRNRRHGLTRYQAWERATRRLTTDPRQQDEPLRILFCGSEAFSIAALEALRTHQKSAGSNILSIDVAARNDKPSGRGMRNLRPPPIKSAAAQLGLRLHQFDTFTGWHLPEYIGMPQPYINLVIAVSFGLLVPPRILNSAKFGGLNVHPSMLPDLRGAAPCNWAIAHGYTHTGISVQTLHPSKFDHGVVLDQTPLPGIAIPRPDEITAHELRLHLAPVAAEMLVKAIQNKLYLQPYSETKSQRSTLSQDKLNLAPKIESNMKALDFLHDDVSTILRKNRAMPKLWGNIGSGTQEQQLNKRIVLGTGMRAASDGDVPGEMLPDLEEIPLGLPFAVVSEGEDIHQSPNPIFLKVKNGEILVLPIILVAGDREAPATAAAARAKLFAEPSSRGSYQVYRFRQPLLPPQSCT